MDALVMMQFAAPLLAIGGAWGGAKVALNGTRERVKVLEADHKKFKQDHTDRLARIETKIDIMMEKK